MRAARPSTALRAVALPKLVGEKWMKVTKVTAAIRHEISLVKLTRVTKVTGGEGERFALGHTPTNLVHFPIATQVLLTFP